MVHHSGLNEKEKRIRKKYVRNYVTQPGKNGA